MGDQMEVLSDPWSTHSLLNPWAILLFSPALKRDYWTILCFFYGHVFSIHNHECHHEHANLLQQCWLI
jgi:hypothetical protein